MGSNLRDEVLRLLPLDMNNASAGGGTFDSRPTSAGVHAGFPALDSVKENISYMTLAEAKQAGIIMYGDAMFSIDAYPMASFPSFAHFVATLIVHESRGVRSLRSVDVEQVVPEKGWKTLFGRFAKGVTGSNIFSGRKRLGPPIDACRILSTGNEQLYAVACSGGYATLFLQSS